MLRILLVVFSVLGLGTSLFWFVYVQSLACAYSGPGGSQNCRIQYLPWEFGFEDFMILYLPVIVFTGLLIFSIVLLNRRR